MDAFHKLIESKNYFYFLGGYYIETSTRQYVLLQNPILHYYFIDKESGNIVGGTQPRIEHTMPSLNMVTPYWICDDYFVTYMVEMPRGFRFENGIISEMDNKMLSQRNEDDNPVLVFFKLKHF